MLTQFFATILILAGVLIGAAGAHWRRVGGPPALKKLQCESSAYLAAFAEVWERDVRMPLGHQYRRLGLSTRTRVDQLAAWATRTPEPRPTAATPALIPARLKTGPLSIRITIGASRSILAPAGTSHRYVPGVSEPFEEWRLRTWAETLHASSVELIREKATAAISSVEVLYGRLTELSDPARFPVGVS